MQKLGIVAKLASQHSILFLQEVHGFFEDISTWLHQFAEKYVWFHSPCLANGQVNPNAGGVLCLAQKNHFVGWDISFREEVPGRIMRLDSTRDEGNEESMQQVCFSGAHNFDISVRQMARSERRVNTKVKDAKTHPSRFGFVLAADLNLPPRMGQNLPLSSPSRTKVLNSAIFSPLTPQKRPNHKAWTRLL